MKKILLVFTLVLVLLFSACADSSPEQVASNDADENSVNEESPTQEAEEPEPEEPEATEEETTEATPEPEETEEPYTLGSTIEFDDLLIFFKSSEVKDIDNSYADCEEAVLIEIDIQNLSDESHGLNLFYHKCFAPSGVEAGSAGAYFDTAVDFLGEMRPGSVMSGHLVYDYSEDGEYVIEFADLFSDPIEVFIPVKKDEAIVTDTPSSIQADDSGTEDSGTTLGIGDSIEFDDLTIKFIGVSVKEIDNKFADAEFAVLINVEITNNKDESHTLNMFYHKCFAPNGLETDSAGAYFDSAVDFLGDMRPGATMVGDLVYDYSEDGDYIISFSDILSDPIEVKVNIVK